MAGPTEPGQITWRAKRWVPFDESISISGIDLTGATMLMQVRLYRDAPGAALVALTNVAAPAQGLSVTVATVSGVPVSTIRIIIAEAAIEALLPYPGSGVEAGADVKLVWDMLISNTGMAKARWFEGPFIIVPGVTQA